MIRNTILESTSQKNFIQNISYLKGNSSFKKPKNLTSPLILTPLIDVFSILVVYLLLNFSVAKDVPYVSQGINLPSAKNGSKLENYVVVKFKSGKYFIEEDEVLVYRLAEELLEHRLLSQSESLETSKTLVVQADKEEKYKYLNEIILAANQTGYTDIKFVVLSGSPQWLKQQ